MKLKIAVFDLMPILKNGSISILLAIITCTLIIDTIFSNYYRHLDSIWGGIFILSIISSVYWLGNYSLHQFIKSKIGQKRGNVKSYSYPASMTFKLLRISQYVLFGIFIFTVAQTSITSQYFRDSLIFVMAISYGITIFITSILAWKFLLWYRISHNPALILYGVMCIFLAIYSLSTMIFMSAVLLSSQETYINSELKPPIFEPDPLMSLFPEIYSYSSYISFVLLWISTALLLRNYSKRLSNIKYVIITAIALFPITLGFLAHISPLYSMLSLSPSTFNNIAFAIYIAGGILSGFVFWSMAKDVINTKSNVRDYIMITGYGFMLLFISREATLGQAPFPPFGIISVSCVGFASYLILMGIRYMTISISHDIKLRQLIRNSLKEQLRLLDSIGTANMQQELEKRVFKIAHDKSNILEEQTGIDPSLTEDDIKQYMDMIIKEKVNKE